MDKKQGDKNICPKCGCGYIITSIDFKRLCMCNEPKRYKMLKMIFESFDDKDNE